MLDMAEDQVNRPPVVDMQPIVYEPIDGDKLAEQERRRRRDNPLWRRTPEPGRTRGHTPS